MEKTGKLFIIMIIGFLFVLSGCSKDVPEETQENVENLADESTGPNDDNTEMTIESETEENVEENTQIKDNTQITEEENIIEEDSEQQTETSGSCVDSDDGLDYYVKGTVTVETNDTSRKYVDYCRTGKFEDYVYEYHCINDSVASENYDCAKGCSDGKCYQ